MILLEIQDHPESDELHVLEIEATPLARAKGDIARYAVAVEVTNPCRFTVEGLPELEYGVPTAMTIGGVVDSMRNSIKVPSLRDYLERTLIANQIRSLQPTPHSMRRHGRTDVDWLYEPPGAAMITVPERAGPEVRLLGYQVSARGFVAALQYLLWNVRIRESDPRQQLIDDLRGDMQLALF